MPGDPHSIPEPPPHVGAAQDDRGQHERFETAELAILLSHYDLGVIREIRPYLRGSRLAPKLIIRAQRGDFLLKRRAPGKDDPYRVAFAHDLQVFLALRGYPVARLVGTRAENNSMLQMNGRIYELFEFASGRHFDQSPQGAEQAGKALGSLHRLLASHRPKFEPPVGSYHAASGLDARFDQVLSAVSMVEPQLDQESLKSTCAFLRKSYHEAARRAEECGYSTWPRGVIHGDWHPGNLIYREGMVVAVLDFDSARLEPRMADVANAALQFSMRMAKPEDPASWPEGLDATRLRSLIRGYDGAAQEKIQHGELSALPWLIIEALIVESVVPIAATGSFARIPGSAFLAMVESTVRWIRPRADKMTTFLEG
jgi:homoserine kinase type II